MTVKGPKARTKHPDRSGWCLEDVQGRQKGAAAQIVLCHNGVARGPRNIWNALVGRRHNLGAWHEISP